MMSSGSGDGPFTIKQINDLSPLKGFVCGVKEMDDFISSNLAVSAENGFCRVYTFGREEEVYAMFSLSCDSLVLDRDDKSDLAIYANSKVNHNYANMFWEKRSYPALEITYLAVALRYQGRGYGRKILSNIALMARRQTFAGCQFLTVEALVDRKNHYSATGFYSACGFVPCEYLRPTKSTLRMFSFLY